MSKLRHYFPTENSKLKTQNCLPGLVDLQVNGYKGVDFSGSDLTEADFVRACRAMLAEGTTAFLPTMITSPEDIYRHNLPIMAKVLQRQEFHGCLPGIHLEGPFISPQEGARGVHNPDWIRKPNLRLFQKLLDWANGSVKLITIAADLEGAEELARYAVGAGISVSLGHQMADEDDLDRLVQAGAVALTHLGNGVPAMLARHHNPVWAGLAEDRLAAMIITDSHHLPASVVKTIIRTKGEENCVVVSDASPLAGLAPGSYPAPGLPGRKAILTDSGQLYELASGYLIGSSATMLQCMNWLASLNILPIEDCRFPIENPKSKIENRKSKITSLLAAMGFYNPLRIIGLAAEDVTPGPAICFDEDRQVLYLQASNNQECRIANKER
jgi:N-acetylglucosamine-6-phosphate deacetylase